MSAKDLIQQVHNSLTEMSIEFYTRHPSLKKSNQQGDNVGKTSSMKSSDGPGRKRKAASSTIGMVKSNVTKKNDECN